MSRVSASSLLKWINTAHHASYWHKTVYRSKIVYNPFVGRLKPETNKHNALEFTLNTITSSNNLIEVDPAATILPSLSIGMQNTASIQRFYNLPRSIEYTATQLSLHRLFRCTRGQRIDTTQKARTANPKVHYYRATKPYTLMSTHTA